MVAAKHLKYDVFISYRWVDPDQKWVREHLDPALREAGLNVCLDVRDFVPGQDLILEMERAVEQSRHAVCVVSPDYFTGKRIARFEQLMLRRLDPDGISSRLIPLILRATEIPEWIRGLISVDWTVDENQQREWEKLLRTLDATNFNATRPGPLQLVDSPPPPPPDAPANLTAQPVSTSEIDLRWTDGTSDGFKIERSADSDHTNFKQVAQTGAHLNAYSDAGLASNTSYSYRVRAFTRAGGDSA
ncbi:MAG: TIR domain-containing protein, partial [Pyrinomonadaceae bacterium]